jgi:hypothetical protein
MFDDQTNAIYTTMAHPDFGDEKCCGCLYGLIEANRAASFATSAALQFALHCAGC